MSTWHPPAPPGAETGPLPRRWPAALALQFCLQWFWLPFRVLFSVLGGGSATDCTAESGYSRFVLTPSRYRLERRGTREEWEAWADRALDAGITRGTDSVRDSVDHNAKNRRYQYSGSALVPATTMHKRYYRGIGAEGLAVLAARRGWQVAWGSGSSGEIRIFQPQPEVRP